MTADRIKEIQEKTAFPDSVSVCQALLQVWNECEQDKKYTYEDMRRAFFSGNVMRDIDEFNCFLTTI
jgi:hypothetical protein